MKAWLQKPTSLIFLLPYIFGTSPLRTFSNSRLCTWFIL